MDTYFSPPLVPCIIYLWPRKHGLADHKYVSFIAIQKSIDIIGSIVLGVSGGCQDIKKVSDVWMQVVRLIVVNFNRVFKIL